MEVRLLNLVDPELRDAAASLEPFKLNPASIPLMREAFLVTATADPELLAIRCRSIDVPGGCSSVPLVVYEPQSPCSKSAVILDIHGGGFLFGSAAMNDRQNRALVRGLEVPVVSVNYRLAPEHAYPTALEDCIAAFRWCKDLVKSPGTESGTVIVLGNSAGGGLAAALSLRLRDSGEELPDGMVLLSPMLDDRTDDSTERIGWSGENNHFAWTSLLGVEAGSQGVPCHAAPARAESLAGMPPTFISVGSVDLFAAENIDFARRLLLADVPTELHVYPGAFHGFARFAPDASVSRRNLGDLTAAISRMAARLF
jgi:triacylglycerol lipase